jgi:hypothetical protein
MNNTPIQPLLIGPGVFIAPFLSPRGRPVLLAIDSQHRECARKELGPRADFDDQVRCLRGLLALLDPRRT